MIKVFGHKSPDTDAVGSAVLWAWYLSTHTASPATPYILGSLNKETQFVLDRFNVSVPELLATVSEEDDIVIVDTNNPQELFGEETSSANILTIIDHHRLSGGLTTKGPIDVAIRPVASTATVIHDLMGGHIETMPKDMIGIMLSCILSDTLGFRSPTTTPHDRNVAEKLAQKIGIDIPQYVDEMLAAKSDVSEFSDHHLVLLDSKEVTLSGMNIRVSVVETTSAKTIIARKEGIVAAIEKFLVDEPQVKDVLFFAVDVVREEAVAFTYNPFLSRLIADSFGIVVDSDLVTLPGVLSRKKQIVPVLKIID